MGLRGIIFDLDGVLVHTDQLHYQAWKMLADKLGIPFTEKDNDRLRGVSRSDSLEILLEGYAGPPLDPVDKEALCEEKNSVYRQLLQRMDPGDVTDEARQALEMLRQEGYRLAVGSSSRNARFIMEKTNLKDYFHAVADGSEIQNSKPHPEVFLLAAKKLGVPPEQCVVVEDAEAGLAATIAAGMTAAGINSASASPLAHIPLGRIGDLRPVLSALA